MYNIPDKIQAMRAKKLPKRVQITERVKSSFLNIQSEHISTMSPVNQAKDYD